MPTSAPRPPDAVAEALALLDVRRLVLAIHDPSFPSAAGEDHGRGSPYSRGGRELLAFARAQGFDAVQLGPQGRTSEGNASPYDGTLFSRSVLSLDLFALAEEGWVDPAGLERLVADNPSEGGRVPYRYVHDQVHALLGQAWGRFRQHASPAHREQLASFAAEAGAWLERDALFEALAAEHGTACWRDWPGEDRSFPYLDAEARRRRTGLLRARWQPVIDRYVWEQWLSCRQHDALRRTLGGWELGLFGDLQVGVSLRDAWALQPLLLTGYHLGAPPSRTNPAGQPWGYGVLDPDQYRDGHEPGPVLRFLQGRLHKMLAEYDGIRIDHPHGLVCPWVYRTDDPDTFRAVQQGARLFSSPDLPDHPWLARWSIPRPDQLDPTVPRYDDRRVRELDQEQVERYAVLFDTVLAAARSHGRDLEDVVCEVLSTQPYPLARVMGRIGLGRFRVTQKARLDDPEDVYRSENACAEDWVMVGNHDTPPIWMLARAWAADGRAGEQARYLAERLCPDGDRQTFAARLAADPHRLVHAKVADLLASPARHVMVFFADLFGCEEVYNEPGTVNETNWTLRVPADWKEHHLQRAARGEALNLPAAMALALKGRGEGFSRAHRGLIERLEALGGGYVV